MDVDLDLVKLRTLVAIRDTGSMTAAAAALGYTTGAARRTAGGPGRVRT